MTEPKERISIAIDKELLDWIDKEIESKRFANRSHAIQLCVMLAKAKEGGKSD